MYTALAAYETMKRSTRLPSGNSGSLGRVESVSARVDNGKILIDVQGMRSASNISIAFQHERDGNTVVVYPKYSVMSGSVSGTMVISRFANTITISDNIAGVVKVVVSDDAGKIEVDVEGAIPPVPEISIMPTEKEIAPEKGISPAPDIVALTDVAPGIEKEQTILNRLPANSADVAVQKVAALRIRQAQIVKQSVDAALDMVPELTDTMQKFFLLPVGLRRVISRRVQREPQATKLDVFESFVGFASESRGLGEYYAYSDEELWPTDQLEQMLKSKVTTTDEKKQIEYALAQRNKAPETDWWDDAGNIIGKVILPLAQGGLQIWGGLNQQEAAEKAAEQQQAYQAQLLATQAQMAAAQAQLAKQMAAARPTVTTQEQAVAMASSGSATTGTMAKIKEHVVKYAPYAAIVGATGLIGWFFLKGKKNAPQSQA